jgi:hypothetical protein
MFRNSVFKKDVNIMPNPTDIKERNDAHEMRSIGTHLLTLHNISDLTPAFTIVCHTIAHAPHPLTASQIPTTAPKNRPIELLMATGRTFIALTNLLV